MLVTSLLTSSTSANKQTTLPECYFAPVPASSLPFHPSLGNLCVLATWVSLQIIPLLSTKESATRGSSNDHEPGYCPPQNSSKAFYGSRDESWTPAPIQGSPCWKASPFPQSFYLPLLLFTTHYSSLRNGSVFPEELPVLLCCYPSCQTFRVPPPYTPFNVSLLF